MDDAALLIAELLTPTRIYVEAVRNVMRDWQIHGMVHVTGGGFYDNIVRILPKGVTAATDGTTVTVKGAKGTLALPLRRGLSRGYFPRRSAGLPF